MKTCTKCLTTKAHAEFSKKSGRSDGLRSWCKDCVRLDRAATRERDQAAQDAWRKANPEKVKAMRSREYRSNFERYQENNARWQRENRDKVLARSAKRQRSTVYGLADSVGLELRSRNCDMCGTEPGTRAHAIDHCHETGAVRGVLCHKCNKALGLFGDSPELLARAIWYLTRGADYRAVDQEA